MTTKEVRELLVLKEWPREVLAKRLGIVRNTVDRWFSAKEEHRRYITPEHADQMRAWLEEARDEARKQPA